MAIFPANATFLFQTARGPTAIVDDVPSTQTRGLLVVASVRTAAQKDASATASTDVDLFKIPLTGRAVTPKALPNTLKAGTQAIAYLWRLQGGFKLPTAFSSIAEYDIFLEMNRPYIQQQGTFFTKAVVQSRFGVQSVLGDQIDGHLVTEVAWDEPL